MRRRFPCRGWLPSSGSAPRAWVLGKTKSDEEPVSWCAKAGTLAQSQSYRWNGPASEPPGACRLGNEWALGLGFADRPVRLAAHSPRQIRDDGETVSRGDAAGVKLRRASAADSQLLAELGAETFSDAFARSNDPQDMNLYLEGAFSPEIQAAELADPASTFLIAEIDGEPVGYARLLTGEAPAAISGRSQIEIVRLYARTQWVGRGVGPVLMEACLQVAKNLGCDTIWLDVWQENGRAIAFYRKWGFRRVGSQKFQLGYDLQDDLLMERAVSHPGAA